MCGGPLVVVVFLVVVVLKNNANVCDVSGTGSACGVHFICGLESYMIEIPFLRCRGFMSSTCVCVLTLKDTDMMPLEISICLLCLSVPYTRLSHCVVVVWCVVLSLDRLSLRFLPA